MYITGKIVVNPVLPKRLSRLKDIAYNLWWTWNVEALGLFADIDPELWQSVHSNPVQFLSEVSCKKLDDIQENQKYVEKYNSIIEKFDFYINNTNTWFNKNYPDLGQHKVAYFSAEYGLNEILPIYSGGLGVLSGDHCKSASDLGIPFTAIGLFYKQGYFSQHINREGWQETTYSELNISHLPLQSVLNSSGDHVLINVELPGRIVYAKVWEVKVGRISLYLMDSDVEQNSEHDRWLTSRLYGGDQETRIQQEILLGIGGIKVLETLGINPSVFHMNEGHSSFLGLEIVRKLMQEKGLSFKVAREVARSCIVFTTHTPVPAGNDVFPLHMIDRYFNNFWNKLNISRHEFLDLGLKINDNQNFNMTVLALTLAGRKNGVSELHGAVTRNMFNNLWSDVPEDEVPITHITNGIHTLTWLAEDLKEIYNKYLKLGWTEEISRKDTWFNIDNIPDDLLWNTHLKLKEQLINFIRLKVRNQQIMNGTSSGSISESKYLLDPKALTIGFARRFATYKRANLIFRDIERIKKIINNPDMPVQIIFAGKAHPADRPAQEVIKHINDIAAQEGFKGKIVILEDYNISSARKLVQGVDIWLNNPRRPLEASGTSGQKVCINGIVNFSVLDGWWCEGFTGNNGWAIGDDTLYDNEYYQDNGDSISMYNTLENNIIPLFYNRDDRDVPKGWVKLMKESIKSLTYKFSTDRMLEDYAKTMYVPSMERMDKFIFSSYSHAKRLAEWKTSIERNWSQISLHSEKTKNQLQEYKVSSYDQLTLALTVELGNIKPSDIKVEIYYGINKNGSFIGEPEIIEMKLIKQNGPSSWLYESEIRLSDGGEYAYTYRVIPYHPDLINKFDMGLIRWIVN